MREQSRQLLALLRWLFIRGRPVAVNAIPHRRFYVRRYKLWEYVSGLALSDWKAASRVLEFGGAATLPSYLLASQGKEVKVLDTDPSLVSLGERIATRYGWPLENSTVDITREDLPATWSEFDLVMSFCVIEHMSKAAHRLAIKRMAERLAPGGRMVISFEYGAEAPGEGALRDPEDVEALVDASGLDWLGASGFADNGQRFQMDKRHPDRRFTFGILGLVKSRGS
ncbi:MAG: class I SAM-dependent methyltransferase [Planctomycetota bacterium]|jgi:SAM-dependent methyltransferase